MPGFLAGTAEPELGVIDLKIGDVWLDTNTQRCMYWTGSRWSRQFIMPSPDERLEAMDDIRGEIDVESMKQSMYEMTIDRIRAKTEQYIQKNVMSEIMYGVSPVLTEPEPEVEEPRPHRRKFSL